MIGALARKIFGSSNDRRIKGYQPRVQEINALEDELAKLSDEGLRARTDELRLLIAELEEHHRGLGARIELTGPWPPYNFIASDDASLLA